MVSQRQELRDRTDAQEARTEEQTARQNDSDRLYLSRTLGEDARTQYKNGDESTPRIDPKGRVLTAAQKEYKRVMESTDSTEDDAVMLAKRALGNVYQKEFDSYLNDNPKKHGGSLLYRIGMDALLKTTQTFVENGSLADGQPRWVGTYDWATNASWEDFIGLAIEARNLKIRESVAEQRRQRQATEQRPPQSRSEQISQRGRELAEESQQREQAKKEGTLGGHYWGYSKEVVDYVLNDNKFLKPEEKTELKSKMKTKRTTGSIYFDGSVSPTTAKDFKDAYKIGKAEVWKLNAPKRKQTLKVVAAGAAAGILTAFGLVYAPGWLVPVVFTEKAVAGGAILGAAEGSIIDKFYRWYERRRENQAPAAPADGERPAAVSDLYRAAGMPPSDASDGEEKNPELVGELP